MYFFDILQCISSIFHVLNETQNSSYELLCNAPYSSKLRIIGVILPFFSFLATFTDLKKDHVQGGIDTSHDETGNLKHK